MIGLSRLQIYILKENAYVLMTVLTIIALAILLIDTVEQLNTIGSRVRLGLGQAISLSLLKLPALVERTLSFSILIAAMLTFRQLSRRSELSVIRASGVSAWRFLTPVALLAFVIGLVTVTGLSPVGAHLTASYEAKREAILGRSPTMSDTPEHNIWLRDGDGQTQTIVYADHMDKATARFRNVKFIQEIRGEAEMQNQDETLQPVRRIEAATAWLEDGMWRLEDVVEYAPDQRIITYSTLIFPTELTLASLTEPMPPSMNVSFWALPKYIAMSEQVGINASRFKTRLFSLTALPVLFVAMSLIGSIVCLRLMRLGGIMPLVLFGVGSAIILFFVTQLGASFGTIGAVPPVVAAWAPPLSALLFCLAFLAFHEDG